jgi:hypothetical protein
MPVVAGVAQADRLAVLADVGNDQDLRLRRKLELAQHVDLQFAEAARKFDLPGRADMGVAKHQHVVLEVGAVHAGQVGGAERARQVEAEHFGAERGLEGADVEVLAGGGVRSGVKRHDGLAESMMDSG